MQSEDMASEYKNEHKPQEQAEVQEQRYSILSDGGQSGEFSLEQLIELAKKGMMYDALKEKIDEQERLRLREEEELCEYCRLFPFDDPEQTKRSPAAQNYISQGYSLAMAHALELAEQSKIKNVDDGNSKRSTGAAGDTPEREMCFSDEQIAHMSINEIKEKWPAIMASLKRKKG